MTNDEIKKEIEDKLKGFNEVFKVNLEERIEV